MKASLERTISKPTNARYVSKKNSAQKLKSSLGFYRIKWNEVYAKFAIKSKSAQDDLRHSVVEDVLESYKKPQEFSSSDFDLMLSAIDMLFTMDSLIWSPAMGAAVREQGLCKRVIWAIEHAGFDSDTIAEYGAPEEYIAAVAYDVFKVQNWRAMSSERLKKLLYTIKNRVKKANDKGVSLYETESSSISDAEADHDNCPF